MNQAVVPPSIKQKISKKNQILKKNKRLMLASIAKKLLFRQLEKLHTGTLALVENGVRHEFGAGVPTQNTDSSAELYAEMHIHDPSCYADILSGVLLIAALPLSGSWLLGIRTSIMGKPYKVATASTFSS